MEENEINAAWAHKVASTELGVEAKKQLEICFARIKEEAYKNNFSVSLGISINPIAIAELQQRGFRVKKYDGDHRDPRENGYVTITW